MQFAGASTWDRPGDADGATGVASLVHGSDPRSSAAGPCSPGGGRLLAVPTATSTLTAQPSGRNVSRCRARRCSRATGLRSRARYRPPASPEPAPPGTDSLVAVTSAKTTERCPARWWRAGPEEREGPSVHAAALIAVLAAAGIYSRMAFAFALSHGVAHAVSSFSIANQIDRAAWPVALVSMAVLDVTARVVIVHLRGPRVMDSQPDWQHAREPADASDHDAVAAGAHVRREAADKAKREPDGGKHRHEHQVVAGGRKLSARACGRRKRREQAEPPDYEHPVAVREPGERRSRQLR